MKEKVELQTNCARFARSLVYSQRGPLSGVNSKSVNWVKGSLFLAVQTVSETALYLPLSLRVLLLLTYKERPLRSVTFETFDQSDKET